MDYVLQKLFLMVFGGGLLGGVEKALNMAMIGKKSDFSATATFVHTLYDTAMVPIGLSLLVIWFVSNLIEKSMNEQFTYEQLFLLLVKMIVAIFVIDKGYTIMVDLQNAGLALLNEVKEIVKNSSGINGNYKITDDFSGGDSLPEISKGLQEVYKSITGYSWDKKLGIIKTIGAMFSAALPLVLGTIVVTVLKVVTYVIVYLRIFEIFLRTMFAPIAFADFFAHGLNSGGMRFLKNYLAVSIQVVMIYLILILHSVISSELIGKASLTGMSYMFMYLGVMAAAIGALFKSQSLIKEFMGSN